MSMMIRGRLRRRWKFGAAHSRSFGDPNTSENKYCNIGIKIVGGRSSRNYSSNNNIASCVI